MFQLIIEICSNKAYIMGTKQIKMLVPNILICTEVFFIIFVFTEKLE